MPKHDPFGAKRGLETRAGPVSYFDIGALERQGVADLSRLSMIERILLENLVRNIDGAVVEEQHAIAFAKGTARADRIALPLRLSRVIFQDASGLPALMDLAAQRDALARRGFDPTLASPRLPAVLTVDHAVYTDVAGTPDAFRINAENEYRRNRERFQFLKWAQGAIDGLQVVPPGNGIIHQVNLEHLSKVVTCERLGEETVAFPETLVGTDSHTTMINGLGVLGWGVGGIEAQSVLLGEPRTITAPEIIGVRLSGTLPEGATPTDLVLTLTELLRNADVAGKSVEFFGDGLGGVPLPDRATLANMAPEYGAAVAYFPVDDETLDYLRLTGRDPETVDLVERYTKATGLFRHAGAPEPNYDRTIPLDLGSVDPCIAGPKRPEDRVSLKRIKTAFPEHLTRPTAEHGFGLERDRLDRQIPIRLGEETVELRHGSVVIAAITSCVNTSNPTVMIGAGLVAKKAVERGLRARSWVRTSFAPGSRAVARYLDAAELTPALETLGFHVVGFGCMSCGGKTGPLAPAIIEAIEREQLVVAAVLSGNRNFEGRVSPYARAAYLASPMLVVAYALAGRVDMDFASEPIGTDADDGPVFLRDIWPSAREIADTARAAIKPQLFAESYADIFQGGAAWEDLEAPTGPLFPWDPDSEFLCEPPYFELPARNIETEPARLEGARALVVLGDSVTTDHIFPGSMIAPESCAGQYLVAGGIAPEDVSSFTARRGDHEVVARGAFSNRRTRNLLAPDAEGGITRRLPEGSPMFIHDAAVRYREEGTPVIVIAGRDYGVGSARDFAAKGPLLLGVRAVIAESFAATHRSNLIGMGIVPFHFHPGEGRGTLGLTGEESFTFESWGSAIGLGGEIPVTATGEDGRVNRFNVLVAVESDVEFQYLANGGLMPTIMRNAMAR